MSSVANKRGIDEIRVMMWWSQWRD